MAARPQTVLHAGSVQAELRYVVDTGVKPRTYILAPAFRPALPARDAVDIREMRIHDAWPLAGEASLDREGFELHQQESQVCDFHDDEEVERVHYPEIEGLIRRATGAARVSIFDHTRRSAGDKRPGGARPGTVGPQRLHAEVRPAAGPRPLSGGGRGPAEAALRGDQCVAFHPGTRGVPSACRVRRPEHRAAGPPRDRSGATRTGSARCSTSRTTPNTSGSTFPGSSRIRPFCSSASTRPRTGAPASRPIPRSRIPRRPTAHRHARASSCGHSCSSTTDPGQSGSGRPEPRRRPERAKSERRRFPRHCGARSAASTLRGPSPGPPRFRATTGSNPQRRRRQLAETRLLAPLRVEILRPEPLFVCAPQGRPLLVDHSRTRRCRGCGRGRSPRGGSVPPR